jgi:hypothetical protein
VCLRRHLAVLLLVRLVTEGPNGLEKPQRCIDGIVFGLLAGVGKCAP